MVCPYCAAFGQRLFGQILSADIAILAENAPQERQLGVETPNNIDLCAAEEPSWPVAFDESGRGFQTLLGDRGEECASAMLRA